MSMGNLYRMHSLAFPSGDPITQLTDLGVNPGLAETVVAPSGDVAPGFIGIMEERPEFPFSTQQIARVLAHCTQDGVSADLSGGNTDAFHRLTDQFGQLVAEASSAHLRSRMPSAMMCWSTLRASQGGLAEIVANVAAVYDGTNAPLQIAVGQAISTSAAVTELFTLGPVKVNGSWVDGVQEVTIDTGASIRLTAASGDSRPSHAHISSVAPRVTVSTLESGAFTAATPITALLVFFRKMAADGTARVADATAEHIGFSVGSGGGLLIPRAIGGADGAQTFEIPLKRPSAGTAWWTIDTTSAIA